MNLHYRFRQELLHFITTKPINVSEEPPIFSLSFPFSIEGASPSFPQLTCWVSSFLSSRELCSCIFLSLPLESLMTYFLLHHSLISAEKLAYLKSLEQQQIKSCSPFSCHSISSFLLQQNSFKGWTVYPSCLHSSSSILFNPFQPGSHPTLAFTTPRPSLKLLLLRSSTTPPVSQSLSGSWLRSWRSLLQTPPSPGLCNITLSWQASPLAFSGSSAISYSYSFLKFATRPPTTDI